MKPQRMTDRYIRNLLAAGKNRDFILIGIVNADAKVDDVVVGKYYMCELHDRIQFAVFDSFCAVGATPIDACRNALIKAGVSFK
jgi:hypothetical protein